LAIGVSVGGVVSWTLMVKVSELVPPPLSVALAVMV